MTPLPWYWRETDTPWGPLVAHVLDRYVGFSLLAYGEFSPDEWRALVGWLPGPDAIVVDVGANIGGLTIPLAHHAAHVHAFEPQPEMADALEENVRRAGQGRVTVHRAACGAAAGTIRLPRVRYDQPGNFGGVRLGGEGAEVPVMTLDSLHLPWVDLIKIDVEGAELDVLAGATDTVARCRPLCYVEADRENQGPGHVNALVAWFKARRYMVEWHNPPLYSPENHAQNPLCAEHLRNVVSLNIWCTPL